MTKVSFNLPTTITVPLGKGSGDKLVVETSRMAAHAQTLFPALITAAVKVILINSYNGLGKDGKQADKVAAATKKLDAWYRGEFAVIARGDSAMTALREAFILDYTGRNKVSIADAEKTIRDTVHATFGEKESATFGRYLDAVAIALATEEHGGKDYSDEQLNAARESVESYYQGLADKLAKDRAESADKVKTPKIDLSLFKK